VFFVGRSALADETPPRPRIEAGRVVGRIRLDGALDEPDWRNAGAIEELLQQQPRPGEPTPYRTRILVLADRENLYFGFECFDPAPKKIAVHTLRRDGNLDGDDSVAIVLDTFGDGRNGFFFKINAAGARLDGLISGPEELSYDWDGVWDAATRRTPEGWTAEVVIPARTLQFRGGVAEWGFNVGRAVARDRMVLVWSGATLDAKFEDMSRAGRLAGVGGLEQGYGLSFAPYALGRFTKDREGDRRNTTGDLGTEVGYNLTPALAGVLTVNTDFAETEVDSRQINLTRFPLFFPEKRSFFLEGSNLFEFGLGIAESQVFIPFYSRRVGLFEGRVVPIDVGLKVLGRAGRWGIAALDVEMGDASFAPSTNLFAGRVTYDADPHLRLGAIVTDGDPDGIHHNTLAGVDAVWRTSTLFGDKNFFVGLWGASSGGDVGKGRRTGWGGKVDYPNDLWDVSLNFNDFGDSLDPALGFLPRPGTRQYQAGIAYQPRPDGGVFGWVRQFFFELEPQVVQDLRGRTQSWEVFTAPFNVRTESGEHLEANWIPTFERLDVPFEIAPGVRIPPGSYPFTRFRVQVESAEHRVWGVAATMYFGDFFDGRLTQTEVAVSWTPARGHVQLDLSAENDFGELPQGDFIHRLWALKAVYAFTPDLVLSDFVQYDSESRTVGMNARLRWTVRPGNDVFLVWNRGWRRPLEDRGFSAIPVSDQVVLKLRWTFRR
jgi:hypothetical protein